jgi:hypothetical protein
MVSVACAGDMERTAASAGLEEIGFSGLEQIAIPAPELAAVEGVSSEQTLSALAAMLKGADVVQMPPPGVENFANMLDVTVKIADCSDSAGEARLNASEVAKTLKYWNTQNSLHATTLAALAAGDIHITYKLNDIGVRDYLVSLVRKADKAAAQALLQDENFGANYTLIQTYDTQAEIIGRETIIIKPWDAAKALVITLGYAAS